VIGEVVAGVLAEVITDAGMRIGIATSAMRGRRHTEDSAIARWFDTYQLTDRVMALPDLGLAAEEWLEAHLDSDEVQAVLHELLAARLTKAPATAVERLRVALELTLLAMDPPYGISVQGLASGLFDYYDDEICEMVARLEGAEPTFWRDICSDAMSARMIAILHAIERHVPRCRHGRICVRRPTSWSATGGTWSSSTERSNRRTSSAAAGCRSRACMCRRASCSWLRLITS
jgi:hypothetical protein